MSDFTYAAYDQMVGEILNAGYRYVTLQEFFSPTFVAPEKMVVNRIDVDLKIDRLRTLRSIFKRHDVRASIYVRLHAAGYNLLNFGTIRLLQDLLDDGHEIGLHTEMMDASGFLGVDGPSLLKSELHLLETVLGKQTHGTASHGDMTPFNNLDFWKHNAPSDFGLSYEAYDTRLWENCRYVSDSEWTRWKSYDNGSLRVDDRRTPQEHAFQDQPPILYLLTHPESWYEHYIHE